MDQQLNFDVISQKEQAFDNVQTLNKSIDKNKNLILCVNIRSINQNFEKLETFIECLAVRPSVIICTETWNVQYTQLYNLSGYKSYYSESKVNKADGVMMYIKEEIYEYTEIIVADNIRILSSVIKLIGTETIRISAIYRSHDIKKYDFIHSLKKFLRDQLKTKNHCIIGDFNIDILDENFSKTDSSDNLIKQEFLNDLMEHKFTPCFSGITRPSCDNKKGTCINNFYIKTNNININSFKITNPFNDHYPLFVTIDKLEINKPSKPNLKLITYNKLKHVANNTSWYSILLCRILILQLTH